MNVESEWELLPACW